MRDPPSDVMVAKLAVIARDSPSYATDGRSRARCGGFWRRETNDWSAPVWRRLATIPFDPMYNYDAVTWKWLDQHAAESIAQVIPPALAGLTTPEATLAAAAASAVQPLRFTGDEVRAWWDDEGRVVCDSGPK